MNRSPIYCTGWFALLAVFFPAVARAQGDFDRVHLLNGQSVAGHIDEMTKNKVVVQLLQGPKEVPVNEIKYVQFASEPRELMTVRNDVFGGHYEQVVETLDKIPPPQRGSVESIRQDIDYYNALAAARLAAGGAGDAQAAGRSLLTFINANKDSYHFYDANEAIGDLLVSIGRYDQAATYYNELASAPWPDFRLRAKIGLGRALEAQDKPDQAMVQFELILASDAKGKSVENLQQIARIGKARCLVDEARPADALKILQQVIDQAPPDANQILAMAYNALGEAYLKTKQPKEALYAFLHVDLLYNQVPDQHAEALYHLKGLWDQMSKPDRSREAGDTLKSKYASSRWNK